MTTRSRDSKRRPRRRVESPRPTTAIERATILALAIGGMAWKAIAVEAGRPQGTINGILSKAILQGELERRRRWDEPRKLHSYT